MRLDLGALHSNGGASGRDHDEESNLQGLLFFHGAKSLAQNAANAAAHGCSSELCGNGQTDAVHRFFHGVFLGQSLCGIVRKNIYRHGRGNCPLSFGIRFLI